MKNTASYNARAARDKGKVFTTTNAKQDPKDRKVKSTVDANCVMTTKDVATGKVTNTMKLSPAACKRARGTASPAEIAKGREERKDGEKKLNYIENQYEIAYEKATADDKRKLRAAKGSRKFLTQAQISKALGK